MPLLNTRSANFKWAKVLVIEDNIDHWTLMKRAMLQRLPEITPVRVDTPDQALVLLNDWCTQEWELPKLIFQDLYLPSRTDGWSLLQQIKAMPAPCNQIPVIIMSASSFRDDINEAYERGSASYAVKPINFTEWLTYFDEVRAYWWETVALPPVQFSVGLGMSGNERL